MAAVVTAGAATVVGTGVGTVVRASVGAGIIGGRGVLPFPKSDGANRYAPAASAITTKTTTAAIAMRFFDAAGSRGLRGASGGLRNFDSASGPDAAAPAPVSSGGGPGTQGGRIVIALLPP